MTATVDQTQDVNAVLAFAFGLAADVLKANKAKAGVGADIQAVLSDAAVMAAGEMLLNNASKLPADFKSLGMNDYLGLIPTVYAGIQQIITANQ